MPLTDIRAEKLKIRQYYREIRDNITPENKALYDKKILRKLSNLWRYREEDLILTYVSARSEVDTQIIIEKALADGKRVAVPKCIEGTALMDFYLIESLDDLAEGAFGILEPEPLDSRKITDFTSGLCIVPAFVFDKAGYRVGYGKGYYDRFLMQFQGRTVGLCYSCCLCDSLPFSKHDKSVDTVITERKVICKN